jgi:hypothetical protein
MVNIGDMGSVLSLGLHVRDFFFFLVVFVLFIDVIDSACLGLFLFISLISGGPASTAIELLVAARQVAEHGIQALRVAA